MKIAYLIALSLLVLQSPANAFAADDWKAAFQKELPLLGHRNWIAIVDSAYPLQISSGIKTVATGVSDPREAARFVLETLTHTRHVQPILFLDRELHFISENDAAGIRAYRSALDEILAQHSPAYLPHEEILGKLNEAGKMYRVLILKTNGTLPYTSVFIRLDCGYWSLEKEARLRASMKKERK